MREMSFSHSLTLCCLARCVVFYSFRSLFSLFDLTPLDWDTTTQTQQQNKTDSNGPTWVPAVLQPDQPPDGRVHGREHDGRLHVLVREAQGNGNQLTRVYHKLPCFVFLYLPRCSGRYAVVILLLNGCIYIYIIW